MAVVVSYFSKQLGYSDTDFIEHLSGDQEIWIPLGLLSSHHVGYGSWWCMDTNSYTFRIPPCARRLRGRKGPRGKGEGLPLGLRRAGAGQG